MCYIVIYIVIGIMNDLYRDMIFWSYRTALPRPRVLLLFRCAQGFSFLMDLFSRLRPLQRSGCCSGRSPPTACLRTPGSTCPRCTTCWRKAIAWSSLRAVPLKSTSSWGPVSSGMPFHLHTVQPCQSQTDTGPSCNGDAIRCFTLRVVLLFNYQRDGDGE